MNRLPSECASAERDPVGAESEIHQQLVAAPLVRALLNSFPGPAAILNEHRQAVMANQKLAELVDIPVDELLGLRLGELLDCRNWRREPWGCGTTTECRDCGALHAILASQADVPAVQDCCILCEINGQAVTLERRVWATPITFAGERLTVLAMVDISAS